MNDCIETIVLRAARLSDMEQIARIYAHYVTHTTVTFETEPPSIDELERRYLDIWVAGTPYLVALEGDTILGYAYAAPFKARAAYRYTLEHSIYLDPNAVGKGLGRKLLEQLIETCSHLGFAEMLATIAGDDNHASLGLHARCGFVPVGLLTRVGFKHDRWLNVTLMQRSLRAQS
ncbi:GNAT family N-acetyltransferase [Burkholderia gladioli]|uniref:GNAT family N-acetyltransferase n=1 Tax=Burkholderia gladioli TaxID=28095 RepID=UPI001CF4D543|nr:GNAT family N-acetyltransferase [Burkholderia gladioli]MCA8171615.1 N-acetyltransferase family protein [Burkholderia gladioli]MDD1790771.1 N-acetyltransferase family protein [Burkholderia gladioli]